MLWFLFLLFPSDSKAAVITQHPNWHLLDDEFCGISNSDRIIGGVNAKLGAYPWMARIRYSFNKKRDLYKCSGALINKFYVITAGHCLRDLPTGLKVDGVRLGEHNTLTDPDCEHGYCAEPVQDIVASSIIIHEEYDEPRFKNDIGLIRLKRPATINEFVQPICMIRGPLFTKNFIGETAEIAGWGIFNLGDPRSSTVLQTIKVPIVKTEKCAITFKKIAKIDQRQICAGGIIGKDSCGGDSGGPLMIVDSLDGPPRYYLLGIVSFGVKRCAKLPVPAVYTKVTEYVSWILDEIYP